MSALAPRFMRFARTRGLITPGDRILVALSGGADSMVLLHLLQSHAKKLHVEVFAAHFDHGMRTDSAADAVWLAGQCTALGVPLMTERSATPLRGETAARAARYRFLEMAARAQACSRIATAHHADDQIETIVFRLLRGTGIRGLAGIPVRRGPFIRPLLRFHKKELLAYAAAHDIGFREDPTNAQLHFMRNRIRKTVLPALEAVKPAMHAAILSLARHSARTEKAWRRLLAGSEKDVVTARENRMVELARPVLLEYHPQLRARVLRHEMRRFGVVPGRAQTRQLVEFCRSAQSGAVFAVSPGVRIERAFDRIRVIGSAVPVGEDTNLAIQGADGQGGVRIGGRSFNVAWSVTERSADAESFDPAVLASGLVIRAWRAGDRMRLPYGTKKLKKLFAENRVPASERTRIPVLTDSHGRVLWAVGVARSIDALPPVAGPVLNITVGNAESS